MHAMRPMADLLCNCPRNKISIRRLSTRQTVDHCPLRYISFQTNLHNRHQSLGFYIHFYSAAALHAMQSAVIATAIPSVCPSVTRWYPIQTNEHRITRSSLWGSKNILVFWYQQWLGGDDPFHLKFALKVTHPPLKCADFDQYLLITSQS